MASTVSIRMTDEMKSSLEDLSKALRRTKSFIVKAALEEYLEERMDDQIALERLNDKNDAIVSEEEMWLR